MSSLAVPRISLATEATSRGRLDRPFRLGNNALLGLCNLEWGFRHPVRFNAEQGLAIVGLGAVRPTILP